MTTIATVTPPTTKISVEESCDGDIVVENEDERERDVLFGKDNNVVAVVGTVTALTPVEIPIRIVCVGCGRIHGGERKYYYVIPPIIQQSTEVIKNDDDDDDDDTVSTTALSTSSLEDTTRESAVLQQQQGTVPLPSQRKDRRKCPPIGLLRMNFFKENKDTKLTNPPDGFFRMKYWKEQKEKQAARRRRSYST